MKKQIVILGAGISGLTLAWALQQKYHDSIEIHLIEKRSRVGGWIQTIRKEGFLFELGPHSCRTSGSGVATLQLIEQLGLEHQVIVADSAAQKRYLYIDQRLTSLPTNPFFCLFSRLTRDLPRAIFHDLCCSPSSEEDEGIYSFFARRFSPEIAEKFIDPLVSGIYAGDMHRLSMRSCFPKVFQWEREYGSVTRGMFARRKKEPVSAFIKSLRRHPIFTLKEGMETLPMELAKRLSKPVITSCHVKVLQPLSKQGFEIVLDNGSKIVADSLFSTIPAKELAVLIAPMHSGLALDLSTIESVSVAMIHLGYRQQVLQQKGFGHLIPRLEKEEVLGIIWDSCVFPQQNQTLYETRLTVMLGGEMRSDLVSLSEQELVQKALKAVSRQLGIARMPDAIHCSKAWNAIPQYYVGHASKLEKIQRELNEHFPGLSILGSSYHGVSVNDCIANALICSFPLKRW